ncbi:hypothetical protein [Nocardia acidivorans]|uniref:hypothetical protein n=1 Tax=Nocardia acidivorans TaxID=404580 RepID=UPI00082BCD72|nr:hypothetical protein [Nocardia acidivorans]
MPAGQRSQFERGQRLDIPLLDLRVAGGSITSSWYGDTVTERDFPAPIGLYRQASSIWIPLSLKPFR